MYHHLHGYEKDTLYVEIQNEIWQAMTNHAEVYVDEAYSYLMQPQRIGRHLHKKKTMADLKKLLATTRLLGKKFRADVLVAGFSLLVIAKSLLSSREDDIRSWGNFLVYFSHKLIQCHTKLRGW
jgi:hypothetical protein